MKNMSFKLMCVVVMVVGLFCAGCNKIDDSLYSRICHKWEWVSSVGGVGGVTQTPVSEGYTQGVDFDKEGRCTKYMNNSVVRVGTYTITRAESALDGKEYDMVILDDGSEPQAITMASDNQLILREDCVDCFIHNYRR